LKTKGIASTDTFVIKKNIYTKSLLIGCIVALLLTTSCDYNNYEDCILEEIPKAKDEQSARYIAHACREKYPKIVDPFLER
jgi:hypothetical protein